MPKGLPHAPLAAVCLFLVACGGGTPTDPPEAPLLDDGEGVIGTKGGIVLVGNTSSPAVGSVLIVPEGAVSTPATFKISAATGVTLAFDPSATVVRFEPAGYQFQSPVLVGLSYAGRASSNPADFTIVHFDPNAGTLTDMGVASVDAQTMTLYAATTHFSLFAVVRAGPAFGELKDTRNNKTYKTVTIGTQTWMAENLNYPNGGGGCYLGKQENCDAFGYHWRLPTDEDWKTLERYLGVEEVHLEHPNAYRGGAANAGGRLKATHTWKTPNEGANNETGFSALPAGMGYGSGGWDDHKRFEHAYFWSATEKSTDNTVAWGRIIWHWDKGIQRGLALSKGHKLSVRCVKK